MFFFCLFVLFVFVFFEIDVHYSALDSPNITRKAVFNPNNIKSYKNYLQNTNRPILSIGTERLACLNDPHGVQLGALA